MNSYASSYENAVEFFKTHAGFGIKTGETEEEARDRCARSLAKAEFERQQRGWTVEWEIDPDADTAPGEGYFVSGNPQWTATLYDESGDVLRSIGGVDFEQDYTREGDVANDPYARVVAAELADDELYADEVQGYAEDDDDD